MGVDYLKFHRLDVKCLLFLNWPIQSKLALFWIVTTKLKKRSKLHCRPYRMLGKVADVCLKKDKPDSLVVISYRHQPWPSSPTLVLPDLSDSFTMVFHPLWGLTQAEASVGELEVLHWTVMGWCCDGCSWAVKHRVQPGSDRASCLSHDL